MKRRQARSSPAGVWKENPTPKVGVTVFDMTAKKKKGAGDPAQPTETARTKKEKTFMAAFPRRPQGEKAADGGRKKNGGSRGKETLSKKKTAEGNVSFRENFSLGKGTTPVTGELRKKGSRSCFFPEGKDQWSTEKKKKGLSGMWQKKKNKWKKEKKKRTAHGQGKRKPGFFATPEKE